MDENKRVIEINGVKLEIDLRQAKVVDQYKVGDPIKVLVKRYGDTWESFPAVIIGVTEYKSRPTIELLYLDGSTITFKSYNADSKDMEIAPFSGYEYKFQKAEVLAKLDESVRQAENTLVTAKEKRDAFVNNFAKVFPVENN